MLVLGTQIHIVTAFFIVAEFAMFCIQSVLFVLQPREKRRGWYLMLLFLLLLYNVTGGLFPDPKINISISLQEMIAYGTGFLMASYFPFYFYKAFDLKSLRWHALFGVPLFLMLPYLIFFVVMYALNGNLTKDIHYGVIAPFVYSLVLLWAMLCAIRRHYRENRDRSYYIEEIAVYCAVTPWAAMTVFSWFEVSQLTEVLCTNTGFVFISAMFILKSVRRHRLEIAYYAGQEPFVNNPETVAATCKRHSLTQKETEIAQLICLRMKYREIADKLFISPRTVDKHVENIFNKVKVTTRAELVRKLNGL